MLKEFSAMDREELIESANYWKERAVFFKQ